MRLRGWREVKTRVQMRAKHKTWPRVDRDWPFTWRVSLIPEETIVSAIAPGPSLRVLYGVPAPLRSMFLSVPPAVSPAVEGNTVHYTLRVGLNCRLY